jgi:hypothetical protein
MGSQRGSGGGKVTSSQQARLENAFGQSRKRTDKAQTPKPEGAKPSTNQAR